MTEESLKVMENDGKEDACLVLPAGFFVILCPPHVAHVAKLADALDSGFHFYGFHRGSAGFTEKIKTIVLIG
jgi:hypothetical protein